MKAGVCPVCRRTKIVLPGAKVPGKFQHAFVLRSHAAATDLSRFQAADRWDKPLESPLCPGSQRVPLSVVDILDTRPIYADDCGAVVSE